MKTIRWLLALSLLAIIGVALIYVVATEYHSDTYRCQQVYQYDSPALHDCEERVGKGGPL